mgnify:CR=1 FL=1
MSSDPVASATHPDWLPRAFARFDALNALDPTTITVGDRTAPRELVQAERLEAWVKRVALEPSLALRVAARCQHLGRFRVPRTDYPDGRIGYLTWRKNLARQQADAAGEILSEEGADAELLSAVRAIQTKQGLRTVPDVQAMEDALCLAFLEHEFVPFIDKYDDDKIVDIVRKTWNKMSARGHELALGLPLSGRALTLVQRALSSDAPATSESSSGGPSRS